MFLSLMTAQAMERLGDLFEQEWSAQEARTPAQEQVVLHDAAREILTRTACRWAGMPLAESEVKRLTNELGLMIDQVARFGPANWYALWRRRGTERWAADIVERVRAGHLEAGPGTALDVFANHRDQDGELLSPQVAAVELINLLRPTVAVARFVVFAAVALHQHPQWQATFAGGDEEDLEPFVQEVRRYYPFFPAVPGRVQQPFTWRGHRFKSKD